MFTSNPAENTKKKDVAFKSFDEDFCYIQLHSEHGIDIKLKVSRGK